MILKNSAEGVTPGTTLTVANSASGGDAFTQIVGTPQYSDLPAPRAGSSRCWSTTANGSYPVWGGNSWTNGAVRCYFYLTANPTSAGILMNLDRANTSAGMRMGLSTAGRIIVQNAIGQTNTAGANGQMPLNTWVRIEMQANVGTNTGNATLRLQAFEGESTTPFYTYANEAGGNLGNAPIVNVRAGRFSGSYSTVYWDDMEARDSIEPIGPVAITTNTGWRYWNGTTESALAEPAGVWNGTSIVPVTYSLT